MPLKNAHLSTEGLLSTIVLVVLEEYVIEETFGIKSHLVADDVEICVSLTERELLTSKGCTDHPHCKTSITEIISYL